MESPQGNVFVFFNLAETGVKLHSKKQKDRSLVTMVMWFVLRSIVPLCKLSLVCILSSSSHFGETLELLSVTADLLCFLLFFSFFLAAS